MLATIYYSLNGGAILYGDKHQAPRPFDGVEAVMKVCEFALDIEMLERFGFPSIYTKSFHNQTPTSNNMLDSAFGIKPECATKEDAIDFMVVYLSNITKQRMLQPDDYIMVYVPQP